MPDDIWTRDGIHVKCDWSSYPSADAPDICVTVWFGFGRSELHLDLVFDDVRARQLAEQLLAMTGPESETPDDE
jgi:hypothetical protein